MSACPKRLSSFLPGHEVRTVPQARLGLGSLPSIKNLVAQQNTGKYDIAIVVLESLSNDFETLKPYMPVC